MIAPTGTEPVKETFRTTSESIMIWEIMAASPVTIFSTPAGNPASIAALPINKQLRGDSKAGTAITVHPAANAALIFRAGSSDGKFQAANDATGPIGCR